MQMQQSNSRPADLPISGHQGSHFKTAANFNPSAAAKPQLAQNSVVALTTVTKKKKKKRKKKKSKKALAAKYQNMQAQEDQLKHNLPAYASATGQAWMQDINKNIDMTSSEGVKEEEEVKTHKNSMQQNSLKSSHVGKISKHGGSNSERNFNSINNQLANA